MAAVNRVVVFIAAVLWVVTPLAAAPDKNPSSLPSSTRSPLLRQVEKSMARGVTYLLENQNADGSWGENNTRYQVGQTSLIALSLLSCGESHQSPKLAKTVAWLKSHHSPMTYNVALHACVFASLPEAVRGEELKNDLRRLLALAETKHGPTEGMYGYGPRELNARIGWPGDFSNTQYGAMGVWYASMTGLEIPSSYWERQERCWRRGQNEDGGWGYQQPDTDYRGKRMRGDSYASMTAAGAATLFITNDHVHLGEAQDLSVPVRNAELDRAVAWMGENFAVDHNAGLDAPPGNDDDAIEGGRRRIGKWVHYMLFGYERVGEASGLTRFGAHNWYDEGARYLVRAQEEDGSWIGTNNEFLGTDTAYALLFLSRGRAPVAIQKLKFGPRWNNRPRDVANFIRFMRSASERHVNWQIVDADATSADLREAPLLYLSGDRPIALSEQQTRSIRAYVEEGGLLIFVNEGKTDAFARSAEAMCHALWPAYSFRDLPANHPVRGGNFPTAAWTDPIRGLSNGVRELAVMFPSGDASWRWQSASGATVINLSPYAPLGNLLLYVTDKANPRFKGEATWIERDESLPADSSLPRISVARLRHAGNWDPEPRAWTRLSNILHNAQDAQLSVKAVEIDPAQLHNGDYSLAHLTATGQIKLSENQQKAMKAYLDAGGLLLFDAAGGSPEAAVSFDALMAQLYPQAGSASLPPDHPIYTASFDNQEAPAHKIESVSYRSGADDRRLPPSRLPRLRGFTVAGRLVAIESPQDVTAAMVGYATGGITGYTPASALELMRNILHFAATRQARK